MYLTFARKFVAYDYKCPIIQIMWNNLLKLTKQYSVQYLDCFLCNCFLRSSTSVSDLPYRFLCDVLLSGKKKYLLTNDVYFLGIIACCILFWASVILHLDK